MGRPWLAALTLLGLYEAPPAGDVEAEEERKRREEEEEEEERKKREADENLFQVVEEPNYRDMPREEWYPPGMTPPPPPTPPPPEEEEDAKEERANGKESSSSEKPPPPMPKLDVLLPAVRVLAGGRKLRAGAAAATGSAAAAAHGCRDRLLELCCLLLRSLCGAHPSAPSLIAAISFETTVTTVTKRHKHVSYNGGGHEKKGGHGSGERSHHHRVQGGDDDDATNGLSTWSTSRAAVGRAVKAAGATGAIGRGSSWEKSGGDNANGGGAIDGNQATTTTASSSDDNSNTKTYFSTTSKGGLGVTTTVTTVVTTTLGDALMELISDKDGSAALRGAAAALYEELCDRGGDGCGYPGRSAEILLGGKRALAAVGWCKLHLTHLIHGLKGVWFQLGKVL